VGVVTALLVTVLALVLHGSGVEGLRHATRWTARASAVFFAILFAASALSRMGGPSVAAALADRRGLGLSFAGAHFVYAGCIVALFWAMGEWPPTVTLVGGGLAYVLLGAMVATSTDAARRLLGASWKRLHLGGLWYIWLIFVQSYLGRVAEGGDRVAEGVFGLALMLGAASLRTAQTLRARVAG
jgi:DMSO/TMAO reductase YedYZ heme-binding membrane subunit